MLALYQTTFRSFAFTSFSSYSHLTLVTVHVQKSNLKTERDSPCMSKAFFDLIYFCIVLASDAARRHFSSMLLQKSFTLWVVRWQRQTELSQFEDLISFKGNMAVARRAFVSWKYCIHCSVIINLC